jgi:hypothetical protein
VRCAAARSLLVLALAYLPAWLQLVPRYGWEFRGDWVVDSSDYDPKDAEVGRHCPSEPAARTSNADSYLVTPALMVLLRGCRGGSMRLIFALAPFPTAPGCSFCFDAGAGNAKWSSQARSRLHPSLSFVFRLWTGAPAPTLFFPCAAASFSFPPFFFYPTRQIPWSSRFNLGQHTRSMS